MVNVDDLLRLAGYLDRASIGSAAFHSARRKAALVRGGCS